MSRAILVLFLSISLGQSAQIYVSQNGAGAQTGADCANAHSYSWINNSGFDWTVGSIISPGDTVHICGIITNNLVIRGSGTAGNPITVYFESGAGLQQPGAPGTILSSCPRNYITYDGGVNGFMQITNSGTLLGITNSAPAGIYSSGANSHDIEVKNLLFRDQYIHVGTADSANNSFDSVGAVYFNTYGSNISIHNCTFTNFCWCILIGGGQGSTINIYSNLFQDYDHGVAGVSSAVNGLVSEVNIYNNHFGSTAAWDTAADVWHHDGIHFFNGDNSTTSNVWIYANLFDGNWGGNTTAHAFIEGDFNHQAPGSTTNLQKNFTWYNNVFITTNYLANGFIAGHGPNWRLFNNTFLNYGTNSTTAGIHFDGYALTNLIFTNNIISGVNTYMSLDEVGAVNFANNLYALTAAGGNPPWVRNGTSYNTLAAWQGTVGDTGSLFTNGVVVNNNATLPAASIAIGHGANLSSIFTTDYTGGTRTVPWDIGAFAVTTDPQITVQPQNQTVNLGQTATFTVTATGTAPITYYWYKQGSLIQAGASSSYTTSATTCAYNGNLAYVVVSNSVGMVTSSTASLTVNGCQGQLTTYPSQIGTANIGSVKF